VTQFWVIAALLCAVAVGVLVWPLWRSQRREGHWSLVGLAAALAIVPVAFALYRHVSNWDSQVAARADEGARLVAELAARLERTPDDVQGWRLLANSYMALGRYDEGRDAYQQVWKRTPQPDDELKIAYAESQILTDRGTLTGEAGRLIEQVLGAEPRNPKALWYGGLVALELGREDLVRARWTSLLAMNPPEQVAEVVRAQLAALGGAQPALAGAQAGGSQAEGPQGAAPAADTQGPTIRLNVSLGAGRSAQQLGPNAQLFIFARAPEGGPPLAVVRRPASAVPGEFTLSAANSMIPGRTIANYPEVTVVARLSASGQPTEQPGDWFAQAVVRPADSPAVALVIDQVVQ
jgi:cytochrome c-type biogenesis protein CcmH